MNRFTPQVGSLGGVVVVLTGLAMGCTTSAGSDASGKGGSGKAGGLGGEGGREENGGTVAGNTGTGKTGGQQGTSNTGGTSTDGGTNSGGTAVVSGGSGGTNPGTGPMSSGPCPNAAYCNDFESWNKGTRPGAPFGSMVAGGSKLVIDEARFVSGKKSVLFEASVSGTDMLTLPLRTFLPDAKRIAYARMMVWLENTPGTSGHWDVIAMSGPAKDLGGATWVSTFSFGGFGDTSRKLLYYGTSPANGLADCSKSGAPAIPLGEWVCVEMGVDETSATPYTVKVKDVVVPGAAFKETTAASNCCCNSTNNNIWFLPDPLTVKFGWNQVHEQLKPIRLWIDDIAVSEKPIGCPK